LTGLPKGRPDRYTSVAPHTFINGPRVNALETQGISLPRLGLGTYRMTGDECRSAVASALELGYRHIDTAEMYGNEDAVGAAIAGSGVARADLHVTTKVWHEHLAPDALRRAFDTSQAKLGLDVIDLYLVHWPSRGMDLARTLETLVALRDEGRTRAIGVANFTLALMREAVEVIGAPIACNQIEYHVLLDQTPLRAFLSKRHIPLVAYCPLAQGRLADHPALQPIARKHGVTPAQVALKWLLDQDGVAAIPKAKGRDSQRANLEALNLSLDDDDRRIIAGPPKNQRFVNPGFAPAWDPPATV